MDTKKVYNENANKWLRLTPSSLSDFTARPLVFEECGELNARSVLDIGCGEGYCARELKKRGAGEYLGIDLSTQMIEAAQEQESTDQYGIEYYACNVVEFTPNKQFDICIAVFLFNYLTVDETQRVFNMVYNALKPEGQFIFTVPHPFFPFVRTGNKSHFIFPRQEKTIFLTLIKSLKVKSGSVTASLCTYNVCTKLLPIILLALAKQDLKHCQQ